MRFQVLSPCQNFSFAHLRQPTLPGTSFALAFSVFLQRFVRTTSHTHLPGRNEPFTTQQTPERHDLSGLSGRTHLCCSRSVSPRSGTPSFTFTAGTRFGRRPAGLNSRHRPRPKMAGKLIAACRHRVERVGRIHLVVAAAAALSRRRSRRRHRRTSSHAHRRDVMVATIRLRGGVTALLRGPAGFEEPSQRPAPQLIPVTVRLRCWSRHDSGVKPFLDLLLSAMLLALLLLRLHRALWRSSVIRLPWVRYRCSSPRLLRVKSRRRRALWRLHRTTRL